MENDEKIPVQSPLEYLAADFTEILGFNVNKDQAKKILRRCAKEFMVDEESLNEQV
jgi:hypothetical protein